MAHGQKLAFVPRSGDGTAPPAGSGSADVRYIHSDHLGSTTLMTDAAGALVERAFFTPFGENYAACEGASCSAFTPGQGDTRHLFTGQEYDPETGLQYFHARFYDARAGRFGSLDPALIGSSPGVSFDRMKDEPRNLNPYAYVVGRPSVLVDPTGAFMDCTPAPDGSGELHCRITPDFPPIEEITVTGSRPPWLTLSMTGVFGVTHGPGVGSFTNEFVPTGLGELGMLGAIIGIEHVFAEIIAIQAALFSGAVVTGVSITGTALAVGLSGETFGLSITMVPFTLTGVGGGMFLMSTGFAGNIDLLNTAFDPIVGRIIPNPFDGVSAIPRFETFSGRQH